MRRGIQLAMAVPLSLSLSIRHLVAWPPPPPPGFALQLASYERMNAAVTIMTGLNRKIPIWAKLFFHFSLILILRRSNNFLVNSTLRLRKGLPIQSRIMIATLIGVVIIIRQKFLVICEPKCYQQKNDWMENGITLSRGICRKAIDLRKYIREAWRGWRAISEGVWCSTYALLDVEFNH